MQGGVYCMRGGVVCARHGTVCATVAHHKIAIVKRISQRVPRFIKCEAFRAPGLVKQRHHFLEIVGAEMIDQFDSAEIGARLTSCGAYFLSVAENCDAAEPFAYAGGGGNHCSGVFSLGKGYVLGFFCGALANLIWNTY